MSTRFGVYLEKTIQTQFITTRLLRGADVITWITGHGARQHIGNHHSTNIDCGYITGSHARRVTYAYFMASSWPDKAPSY
jgi:hypothetical protein